RWAGLSPLFDRAVVRLPDTAEGGARLFHFSGDRALDLPDHPHGGSWSADGRLYAYVPGRGARKAWIIDTETGERSELYRVSFGEVEWVYLSPRGDRAAVCVWDPRTWVTALYIVDVRTREARRLRPLALASLRHTGPGCTAWSPDGGTLGVAAFLHPFITMQSTEGSDVWVARVDSGRAAP
ncbi:MAG: YncE family protein, partial [Planctomycetota bacterium]